MIQVVLAVDLEPDPRILYRPSSSDCAGAAAAFEFLGGIRQELADITGHAAGFDWMLRMDPQIERVYGHLGAFAARLAERLGACEALGDEVGIHTHLYRWDHANDDWYTDYADPDWPVECMERALAAYRDSFGRPCLVHSFGDRWMDPTSVRRMIELGVRVDLTVEPGLRARSHFRLGEHLSGRLPDFRRAPRHPWQPATDDYLRHDPAAEHGLWMLPVTTYSFPRLLDAGRVASLMRRSLRGDLPTVDDASQRWVRTSPSQKPWVFRQACGTITPESVGRCLHLVVRSNEFLAPQTRESIRANLRWLAQGALAEPVRFTTACEAVRAVQTAAA